MIFFGRTLEKLLFHRRVFDNFFTPSAPPIWYENWKYNFVNRLYKRCTSSCILRFSLPFISFFIILRFVIKRDRENRKLPIYDFWITFSQKVCRPNSTQLHISIFFYYCTLIFNKLLLDFHALIQVHNFSISMNIRDGYVVYWNLLVLRFWVYEVGPYGRIAP